MWRGMMIFMPRGILMDRCRVHSIILLCSVLIASPGGVFLTTSFLRSPSGSPSSNWMDRLSRFRWQKKGRVRELKLAVEAAFGHLPSMRLGRVSWSHVWGQFCLSNNSHKLLNDISYLEIYKIKDGDQLRFIRHDSINYNLARTQSEKEDSDLDDEPDKDRQENVQSHYIEILENKQDDRVEFNKGVVTHYEFKLTHWLRWWFPYPKLLSSNASGEDD